MLMERGVRLLSNHLPKVISPRTHALLDYGVVAGGFFALAGAAWNSHRKAAVVSLICGLAETTLALLTDYPGGVAKVIDFPTHGRIDAGFSALAAAMPNLMEFSDERPGGFFRAHALAIATITGITDFEGTTRTKRRYQRAA